MKHPVRALLAGVALSLVLASPTFAVEQGTMKGAYQREDTPLTTVLRHQDRALHRAYAQLPDRNLGWDDVRAFAALGYKATDKTVLWLERHTAEVSACELPLAATGLQILEAQRRHWESAYEAGIDRDDPAWLGASVAIVRTDKRMHKVFARTWFACPATVGPTRA